MGDTIFGKWKHDKSVDFDKWCAAVGAPPPGPSGPEITISQDGNTVTEVTVTPARTMTESHTLGEEVEDKGLGNDFVSKNLTVYENGKLIITRTPVEAGKGTEQSIIREMDGGQMVTTLTVGGVSCKRYFNRA